MVRRRRKDLTGYYHEVSRVDRYVGDVADELKRQGVFDNTMLIFIADNGRPFPRCKTRLYDSGIKTPMVMHFPKRAKPAVNDGIVSVIDISATMLELAGVKKDPRIQGVSFARMLDDPKATTRDVAFAEHNWHVYQSHERMVRHGKWLYIRNSFPNKQNLCVEAYIGGAGEELWAAHKAGTLTEAQKGLFRNPCPADELFDVSKDPMQLNDLAADPKHAEKLQQMRSLVDRWAKETGDTVPTNPTLDRDAPPGKPKKSRKGFPPSRNAGRFSRRRQVKSSRPGDRGRVVLGRRLDEGLTEPSQAKSLRELTYASDRSTSNRRGFWRRGFRGRRPSAWLRSKTRRVCR